jgi:hypothetical protein
MKLSPRRSWQMIAAIAVVGLLFAFGFQGVQPSRVSAAPAQSQVAAAKPPKPSATPKATKTHRPTQTPTSTPTATDTPTNTPTVSPCAVQASISPASGQKLPQPLTVMASDTNACAVDAFQYSYVWTCDSFTVVDECPTFLSQANAAPNGAPSAALELGPNEDFDISVTVCLLGTPNCSPAHASYLGASVR